MYPISFLLPSFAKWIMSTSRQEKRLLGNEFGMLLLYALWVIVFFSLSESKLPTYIMPAVPVICLLLGRMLDLAALSRQPIGATGNWKSSIPRHMAISVSILFVVFACVLIFVLSMRDPIVIATLAAASLVLIVLVACSRLTNIRAAWAAALATTMMFTLLAVTEMLPSIAEMRSVQVAASRLADSPPFKNLPIVFVGRPPYAYSFCLSDKTIYHFGHHAEAIAFLRDNPDTILVASNDDIKKLQKKMNGAICFERKGGHRKLYTSHLRFPIDARSAYRQLPINSGRQAQLPSLLR
jgi:4-amino-4-deoxy-L-arabinose transferase-like glycosyltransferase